MKKGPKSKYDPEIVDEICDRLSEGEPLRQICRDGHMPAWRTFYDWAAADADLAARIARARDIGYDAIALRLRETARGRGDSTSDVQRDKLIVDTDLKLLAKWSPKKYGDFQRTEISGVDGGAIQINATKTDEEIINRMRERLLTDGK